MKKIINEAKGPKYEYEHKKAFKKRGEEGEDGEEGREREGDKARKRWSCNERELMVARRHNDVREP